jgi:hypothetical protein
VIVAGRKEMIRIGVLITRDFAAPHIPYREVLAAGFAVAFRLL